MTLEALEACLEEGVTLFGFDSWTAENPNGEGSPLHHRSFSADALILEGLNLNNVPEGHFSLVALPLSIEKVDGSPVRAVFLPKEVF
jgi:arylformamidase